MTSIWVIKRSRIESPGGDSIKVTLFISQLEVTFSPSPKRSRSQNCQATWMCEALMRMEKVFKKNPPNGGFNADESNGRKLMNQVILCDLFGMVKWSSTRGWKGHKESPGKGFLNKGYPDSNPKPPPGPKPPATQTTSRAENVSFKTLRRGRNSPATKKKRKKFREGFVSNPLSIGKTKLAPKKIAT